MNREEEKELIRQSTSIFSTITILIINKMKERKSPKVLESNIKKLEGSLIESILSKQRRLKKGEDTYLLDKLINAKQEKIDLVKSRLNSLTINLKRKQRIDEIDQYDEDYLS